VRADGSFRPSDAAPHARCLAAAPPCLAHWPRGSTRAAHALAAPPPQELVRSPSADAARRVSQARDLRLRVGALEATASVLAGGRRALGAARGGTGARRASTASTRHAPCARGVSNAGSPPSPKPPRAPGSAPRRRRRRLPAAPPAAGPATPARWCRCRSSRRRSGASRQTWRAAAPAPRPTCRACATASTPAAGSGTRRASAPRRPRRRPRARRRAGPRR
jgi:hypothetical protein